MIVQWRKLNAYEKIQLGDILVTDSRNPVDMQNVRAHEVADPYYDDGYSFTIHRLEPEYVGMTVLKFREPHVCYWPWRAEGLIDNKPEKPRPLQRERKIDLNL